MSACLFHHLHNWPWGYSDDGEAIKSGAIEFLTNPFVDERIIECDSAGLRSHPSRVINRVRFANCEGARSLTMRERQVMGLCVSGMLNKQSHMSSGPANHVKIQRGHVMTKMSGITWRS